jgi:hypothetical protein
MLRGKPSPPVLIDYLKPRLLAGLFIFSARASLQVTQPFDRVDVVDAAALPLFLVRHSPSTASPFEASYPAGMSPLEVAAMLPVRVARLSPLGGRSRQQSSASFA